MMTFSASGIAALPHVAKDLIEAQKIGEDAYEDFTQDKMDSRHKVSRQD